MSDEPDGSSVRECSLAGKKTTVGNFADNLQRKGRDERPCMGRKRHGINESIGVRSHNASICVGGRGAGVGARRKKIETLQTAPEIPMNCDWAETCMVDNQMLKEQCGLRRP